MIPLFKVFMSPEAGTRLGETLYSGYIGEGTQVEQFEKELGKYLDNPYVVTTNSCTAALRLAFKLRFKRGNRILTSPLTCFATTAALLQEGLEPVWVDIDPTTLNIDLEDLASKLDPSIAGVCVVDFGGRPIDYEGLFDRLVDYEDATGIKLKVVEDAAHAIGSLSNNQKIGSFALCDRLDLLTCLSFQAVKSVTTGDGGALLLSDRMESENARLLRWYGMDRSRRDQSIHAAGDKLHMNDLAASIGRSNLPHLDQILERQRSNAAFYRESLIDLCLFNGTSDTPNDWLFPIFVPDRYAFDRRMKGVDIETGPAHFRNDTHPCVFDFRSSLPRMDYIEHRMTCIPCGWWVTDEARQYIAASVRRNLKG